MWERRPEVPQHATGYALAANSPKLPGHPRLCPFGSIPLAWVPALWLAADWLYPPGASVYEKAPGGAGPYQSKLCKCTVVRAMLRLRRSLSQPQAIPNREHPTALHAMRV